MEYLQFLIIIILSPLVNGLIKKFKAGMQGRVGPNIFQPYFDLMRLLKKDMVISGVSSWVFRLSPYIVFSSTVAATMVVPVISNNVFFSKMADLIAVVYILALGRFFMALGGLDAGTAFGGEGSSREMTVAVLVEPMMMLALFTAAISAGSTNLVRVASQGTSLYTPAHLLAFSAFLVAIIAETGRIPVDNPDTHLELTMIHEGMLLEYSGRYLALLEWAHYIKQLLLFTLAIDIFFPFGLTSKGDVFSIAISTGIYLLKILLMAFGIALIESTRAKMRFFQLPSLLGGAFILALLSLLSYVLMGMDK